jgi:hypothetical protein
VVAPRTCTYTRQQCEEIVRLRHTGLCTLPSDQRFQNDSNDRPTEDIVAPGPLERRRRKSLPLAVNKDAYDHRRKGEHDQKAAEYHNQPNTR